MIKIYTKTHQMAPFKKISWGNIPPNPPSKAHGFAMRSMSLATCKFPNLKKKFLAPPPAKSWGRPCYSSCRSVDYLPSLR